jgi:hypothetical protein
MIKKDNDRKWIKILKKSHDNLGEEILFQREKTI